MTSLDLPATPSRCVLPHRNPRITRGALWIAAVATAAVMAPVATGCGLQQDTPQVFALPPPKEQALKEPATTTTLPTTRTAPQTLYFVKAGSDTDAREELVPVSVPIRDTGPQDLPKAVLEQLLKGPTPEQRAQDLRSSIPEGARVDSVLVNENGVATVNLSNLGTIEGPGQRLAAAEIVFTLTEIPSIASVRFVVDDKDASVPLGNSESSEPGEPIGRDAYTQLSEMLAAETTTAAPAAPDAPGAIPPPEAIPNG